MCVLAITLRVSPMLEHSVTERSVTRSAHNPRGSVVSLSSCSGDLSLPRMCVLACNSRCNGIRRPGTRTEQLHVECVQLQMPIFQMSGV